MTIYHQLRDLGLDRDEAIEAMTEMRDGESDFEAGNHRFIASCAIDDIMQDELASDEYVLGCCTPWFIADITGLDMDTIEKAQKAENFELLGALLAKDIAEVQKKMVQYDGYGHHFGHYDGEEHEVGNFHAFRL